MIFNKTCGHFTYFQKQSLYQVLSSSEVFMICGHFLIRKSDKNMACVQIFLKSLFIFTPADLSEPFGNIQSPNLIVYPTIPQRSLQSWLSTFYATKAKLVWGQHQCPQGPWESLEGGPSHLLISIRISSAQASSGQCLWWMDWHSVCLCLRHSLHWEFLSEI